MGEIFAFLKTPENRDTLTWIGGALAAGAGVALTVVRYLTKQEATPVPAPKKPQSPRTGTTSVSADRESTAVGGDVNIGNRTGMSGLQIVLVVAILAGVILIAVTQVGTRVSATNGSIGVGGDVNNSTLEVSE